MKKGDRFHVDTDRIRQYDERVVDDVVVIETPKPKARLVLVHAEKLRADVLIPKSELKYVCKKCGSPLYKDLCTDETCPYSDKPQFGYEGGFKEINIKSKKVKGLSICLGWDCQEGEDGDYDPSDPNDTPYLRFDILYKGEQVDNGSYCTHLKATDHRELLEISAKGILAEAEKYAPGFSNGFKKAMEFLSWSEWARDGETFG
jgi:hypothetical protein